MNSINFKKWIPDGMQLIYSEKNSDIWKCAKVIDSRIYNRSEEILHLVALDNGDSITFSVNDMNKNGKQGTHKIRI